MDKFGVVQPKIQRIGTSGRIQIELPGAKDIERVTKLITSTAELQFWEVYTNTELFAFLGQAQQKSLELLRDTSAETPKKDKKDDAVDELLGEEKDKKEEANQKSLFTYLIPNQRDNSPVIGYAKVKDTAMVNSLLHNREIYSLLPNNVRYAKFLWDYKPFQTNTKEGEEPISMITLYAMKSNRNDEPTIEGDVIADARQDFDQSSIGGNKPVVSMSMNSIGTKKWAKMSSENVGKFVAVVLDDNVYTAPVVNDAILTGNTQISGGSMTINEAKDIATVLKAGKLPAPAHIIQAEVVGPSLGKEAINASLWSFALAILLVLGWMVLYYGRAGMFANVALLVNILFIFGALASFGSVLTLPGIAGIILTIGMSVDANVIIFERIKEALD
ncbi:MAG: protein translocase subunit SecD, partial [Polaribacter sp.]